MALGILVFGDDRVVGQEAGLGPATAFTVTNAGARISAAADGTVVVRDRSGRGEPIARTAGAPRAIAAREGRLFVATDSEVCELALPAPPTGVTAADTPRFDRCATSPFDGARAVGLALGGSRVFVAAASGVAIWSDLGGEPVVYRGDVAAVTAKPDGSELYVLDPQGTVRVIAADSGLETRLLAGGRPGNAIAYAQGPNRLFAARAAEPILDAYEVESGAHESVALGNARTGSFASGATALAVVTRTDFLYALTDGRAVVGETHGSSPFAAIPVAATRLPGDGAGDKLLVAGADGTALIETGRHAFAWRVPGVLLAALLAFVIVLLARRLFASPVGAVVAGLAVLRHRAMYAQARIGMNDVYVGALIVAGWYFVVAAHRPRRLGWVDVLIAGTCFGLAAAAKWAAFYALAGMLVAALAVTARAYERGRPGSGGPLDLLAGRGRNAGFLFISFVVIPTAIYLASYVSWFGGPTIPYTWNFVELTHQMDGYHASLTP